MKIDDVKLYPVAVDRRYPTVTAGPRGYWEGVKRSYFLILRVFTHDGIVGLGEISDIGDKEFLKPSKVDMLRRILKRTLKGEDPFNIEKVVEALQRTPELIVLLRDETNFRLVLCAVDSALYDLMGKSLGVPVYKLIGGEYRKRIRVAWVAYIRDPKFLVDEIQEKVKEGFEAFKLKVGLNIKQDEERLKVVREIAGEEAEIKIDAQGYWSIEEAIKNIKRLEKFNLIGVESPVSREDVEGMVKVRSSVDTPIIEHVNDIPFGLKLIEKGAVDVFNVSTVGCGGIHQAKKVINLTEGTDLECLLGSTLELGVGTAGQAHLAASSKAVTLPSDLIGPLMYTDDVIKGRLSYENGCLVVPSGSGLGVTLDDELLERLAEG